MLAKLSSCKTISAASLATSVPDIPMAIPILALDNAGASFTPSPVIATISPWLCKELTMRIFWSGATRENIVEFAAASSISASLNLVIELPLTAGIPPSVMPNSLPIAVAVNCWSPVIILTLMPAFWQIAIASFTSGLGGSMIPTKPRKINPDSIFSTL